MADLIDRRSSSICQRARYSVAKSSLVVCCGSSKVVTTTSVLVRNPGWVTRIRVSRSAMGDQACDGSPAGRVRTQDLPQKDPQGDQRRKDSVDQGHLERCPR